MDRKHCPRCGSNDCAIFGDIYMGFRVQCESCGQRGHYAHSKREAVAEWNDDTTRERRIEPEAEEETQ